MDRPCCFSLNGAVMDRTIVPVVRRESAQTAEAEAREALRRALDVGLWLTIGSMVALSLAELASSSPNLEFTLLARFVTLCVLVPLCIRGPRLGGGRWNAEVALAFSIVLAMSAVLQDLVTRDPYGGLVACVALPLLCAWVLPWRPWHQVALALFCATAVVGREMWMMQGQAFVPVALILASVPLSLFHRHTRGALRAAHEEAESLKDQFLASMSHEIRTPLNGVLGTVQVLRRSKLSPSQRVQVETIHESGQQLLGLVDEILDLSRIDAGRVELAGIDFALGDVVASVVALFGPPASERGIDLSYQIDMPVLTVIRGDPWRLRQILSNLVSNAIKFTERGSVQIRVGLLEAEDGRKVLFEVEDTGIGIEPAALDRVFDSFVQADAETSRRFGGAGLGLAIARRLARLMRGDISVHSVIGQGSAFRLSMALEQVEPGGDSNLALPGRRVLLCLKSRSDGDAIVDLMKRWGVDAESVCDAGIAAVRVDAAEADRRPYDLLVVEPACIGVEACVLPECIGEMTSGQMPPLGILSFGCRADAPLAAFDAGVVFFLNAPLHPDRLRETLAEVWETRRPTSSEPEPALKGKVLIVEDNDLNRQVAASMLTDLGFDAEVAEDGVSALSALEAHRFAAVIMDCHLPDIDGFEVTRRIRADGREGIRRLPIIGLTASVSSKDRERAHLAGMDDFLSKPVRRDDLRRALFRWIAGATSDLPPVLDVDRVYELTAGDRSTRDRYAAMFRREVDAAVSSLRGGGNGEVDAMRAHLHRLKGAAATIGAVRLLECVRAVDVELEASGSWAAGRGVDRIALEYEAFAAAYDSLDL